MTGSREDLVVYIASTRYDGPAGTDRHMVDHLSRRRPVLVVDPPVPVISRGTRNGGPSPATGLRLLSDRLAVVTPVVPPGISRPFVNRLVAPAMRRTIRDAVARLHPHEDRRAPVRAVVSCRVEPLWSSVPSRRRLYYATDDLVAGAELLHTSRTRLVRQVTATLDGADAVAVVSPTLQAQFREQGHQAELVPNGCEPDAYRGVDQAARPHDAPSTGPVAGFIGYLNERIDLALLEAVVATGTTLLMVGPCAPGYRDRRFEELVARPTVRWVGPKAFDELPGYLRVMDVGLTPYADTAFNRASFPLKTLEYLAAGRAVVASPLPAYDWLATDLIDVAGGPESFAHRVVQVAARPPSQADVTRRRAFAEQHSWARRADALDTLLAQEPHSRDRRS